jgi:crossover junction endodeoxyribonuclease RusA
MITLTLPYPPSVNHYWGQRGNRRFVGKKGVAFRQSVADAVAVAGKKVFGRLQVVVALYPPDRRRRDIDNVQKSLNDALQHAGCFDDDEQIDVLTIERKEIIKGGKCVVVIAEL